MEYVIDSPTSDERTLDTIHDLLRDKRRRDVVEVLANRDPPMSLAELATAVAARESAVADGDEATATTDDVAHSLHHVHLPRLADADVVEYDPDRNAVTANRTDELAASLDVTDDAR